jgi:hypothetical protein
MSENVGKCLMMFEDDVGGCRRTSEDVVEKLGQCLRMSDNVG